MMKKTERTERNEQNRSGERVSQPEGRRDGKGRSSFGGEKKGQMEKKQPFAKAKAGGGSPSSERSFAGQKGGKGRSAGEKNAGTGRVVAERNAGKGRSATGQNAEASRPVTEHNAGKSRPVAGQNAGTGRPATERNKRQDGRAGAWSKGPAKGTAEDVKQGDRIIVTIKRIGINGEGVGYYKRKAVFVEGALPGEVVKANVTKAESGYLNASLVEIEKKSPDRAEPPCPVYEECGGCQLQHMNYEAQLAAKEEIVREAFQRYAGIEELPMRPILGMENPWGYRNKAQLQAGKQGDDIITGLYSAGTHKLVDISGCEVQHPVVNEVMEGTKEVLAELDIAIYNERTRQGAVRTVVARVAQATGHVQLTLILDMDKLPDARRFVQRIREKLPMVKTIAQNVNKGKSPLIFGERTTVLWGDERLNETLGDVRFSLSPRAFFQLNPEQTVKLYDAAKEAASLTGKELVVDAYCGTGTIGMWLAPEAREVRGIELIPEAVRDARSNADTSGITNTRFFEGRAEELLPQWVEQGVRPDVVVVDPPRTGCELPLLQAIAQAKPKRLVYVSCNPSTLAKDCKVLLGNGYQLEWVQPVDMFPQTSHVESVVLMVRK
ncbi:23S rRNA (uracil(1939)-C(5))-methyltransferase RlmD [Paenibacillus sp. GCM10027627]|uniref:23S rRNA (uracil(1939)-C(5))-methyltransferase RlmD n=1 Tax=unclassified Paenibacillus TaxID=185978 RepID=UPI0036435DBB